MKSRKGLELPAYVMRGFVDKFMENGFVIIQSHITRYVFDMPSLPGNYAKRRLLLSSMELPYKLYPLRKRITTISQLIKSGAKYIITPDGDIRRVRRTKFYPIEVKRVSISNQTFNGTYQNFVKGSLSPIITDCEAKYISVVNYNGALVVFDVHREYPETRRYRVKL